MKTDILLAKLDQEAMLKNLWKDIEKVNNVLASRDSRNVMYRHIFSVCARQLSNVSLKNIGNILGKDHATILYALRQHDWLVLHDTTYLSIYDIIYNQVTTIIEDNNEATVQIMKDRLSSDEARRDVAEDILIKMYREKLEKQDAIHAESVSVLEKNIIYYKKYAKDLYNRNERLQNECLRLKNLL